MRCDHTITISPTSGGWTLVFDDMAPLMFLSGRKAEQHARRLGARLADFGDDTEVLIHDRAQGLVGSQVYLAP